MRSGIWKHAHFAINAVGSWQSKCAGKKEANVISSLSQLTKTKRIGAPRVSAPPGPSISQVAKPKGWGMALPGTTKTSGLYKKALLEEVARIALKDIPKTPRLLMKHRGLAERVRASQLLRKAYDFKVTDPIMRQAEKVVTKLPAKLRDKARVGAKFVARDPAGQLAANLVPVPGASAAYEVGKAGLAKLINKLDPVAGLVKAR